MKILNNEKKFKSLVSIILVFVFAVTSVVCAYADVRIDTYSNGNSDGEFDTGIFTAASSGAGKFIVALYKDNKLIAVDITNTEEEIADYRLNLVIDRSDADTLKVFRFDGVEPLCVNTVLTKTDISGCRIHVNENFDDGTNYSDFINTNVKLGDGYVYNDKTGRSGAIPVTGIGSHLVIQADFALGDNITANLICNYNDVRQYPYELLHVKQSDLYINASATSPFMTSKDIAKDSNGYVNIALILDLENSKYSIYVNEELKMSNISIHKNTFATSSKDIMALMLLNTTKNPDSEQVKLDNLKIYSSDKLLDIGDKIANVHTTDFADTDISHEFYERPTAEELAGYILGKAHPRIILNSSKVNELKTSTDSVINSWKQKIITSADGLLNKSANGSYQDAYDNMLYLGLAYLLTQESDYAQRAYSEADALIKHYKNEKWGTPDALVAARISFILAVCYDWAYDGLTDAQKQRIKDSVFENSINPSYKLYHGQYPGMEITESGWRKSDNNWNAVCHGSAIMTSVAFMEHDAFRTSTLMEASIRGLEILMAKFAPAGGWDEYAMYWRLAMSYLTAALATLEINCGSLYGFEDAPGFEDTMLFSHALEGKTSLVELGDSSNNRINSSFILYWSKIFNKPELTAAQKYKKTEYDMRISALDLVYYDPDMDLGEPYEVPPYYYFAGTELVSFSTEGDNGTYILMTGGEGHSTSHDHLDSGAVVVDMKGERLLWDLGAENYDATGYFTSSKRHTWFRARPEAHNIFVINPSTKTITTDDGTKTYYGQSRDAVSVITSDTSALEAQRATMNLTDAYARDADSASRTISLEENNVIIEDAISLKGDANEVCWSWYLKNTSAVNINEAAKTVTVTQNGKNFTISFETSNSISIETQSALPYSPFNSNATNDIYTSTSGYKRLVVKMDNASGNISLKTTIE